MKTSTRLLAISALVAAVTTAPASAQTAGLTGFTGGTTQDSFAVSEFDSTIGWAFTPTVGIVVSSLGWRSDGNIDVAHQIGIWQGETLLASVFTPTGSYANHSYAYAAIPGLTLAAGTQYLIGGRDGPDNDKYYFSVNTVTTDARIAFNGGVANTAGAGFGAPTTSGPAGRGRFGPNFLFTAVPEPASWALMIGGFCLVGAAMRRRGAPATA